MAKQQAWSYEAIMDELKQRKYRPVYYLMGEEAYYIDKIADYIASTVLTEEEQGFNQTVLYGLDTNIDTIITSAKSFPMMAEHQVIIVKEAQLLGKIDNLSFYLKQPMPSTVLVFCHKNGTLDKRKKITAEIERAGVLYESKKLREEQLPSFIVDYLKQRSFGIDMKAANMMRESVGADLNRMTGELDKLIISAKDEKKFITPELVEENIGVSKEFNNFELINALLEKDAFKANRIIKYFEQNSKKNPIQMTLGLLFSFFSNVMLAHYSPDKSENGIANFIGLKWGVAKDYARAVRLYNGVKVMNIIGEIRYSDARSKGLEGSSFSEGDILKELVFKILH